MVVVSEPLHSLYPFTGPEKYGERGNDIPRKVGTYQEVKAHLTDQSTKTLKDSQKGLMSNESNEGVRRYKVDCSQKMKNICVFLVEFDQYLQIKPL